MKKILVISILGFYVHSNAQISKTYGLDIGNANTEGLNVGVEFMNRLEWNKYDELLELVIKYNFPDTSDLENQAKKIYNEFGKIPSGVCFYKHEPDTLWYERTYFSKNQDKIEYLFQILITFKLNDSKIEIDKVFYKSGADIIHRDSEVMERTKKVDANNPPPPPPPFGIR